MKNFTDYVTINQRNYDNMPSKDKFMFYFPKSYQTHNETRLKMSGYVGALPLTDIYFDPKMTSIK